LAGTLTPPRFLLRPGRPLNAVAGRQTDFKLDYLVPDGIGALMVRYCQQLTQAASRIRCLRFVANRHRRLFVGYGIDYRLLYGLFFIHRHIIARIIGSVPMLLAAQAMLWGFLLRSPSFEF
jgi:hypothetical protein